jgi:NitT/TauT family transport system substrate-binding protein
MSSSKPSAAGTGGSKPTSDVSLRLDFSWVADHTAFLMAQAKGYYKDVGLNVDIEQGQGSATTMAVVGSGRDDFGWGDLSTAALSISKGVPLVTVAVVTRHTPFGTECYKNVPFHSPKDLEGHSVILIPQESTAQLWPAYLALNHVDASKIKIINATFANKFSLFALHKADCMPDYYGIGLDLTRYLNKDIGQPIAWEANGVHVLSQGLVTNKSFANAHPDQVKAFVAASLKGWQDVCSDPQAAATFFIQKHPELNKTANDKRLTLSRIKYECTSLEPVAGTGGERLGKSTNAEWQPMLDLLHQYDGMKNEGPPSDYYTNIYLPHS